MTIADLATLAPSGRVSRRRRTPTTTAELTDDECTYLAAALKHPTAILWVIDWVKFQPTGDDRADEAAGLRMASRLFDETTPSQRGRILPILDEEMPRPLSARDRAFVEAVAAGRAARGEGGSSDDV